MPAATLQKLPAKAREIWEAAFQEAKADHTEEDAAKIAWGAVKNAGYNRDKDGEWHKMHLVSMYFTKASAGDDGVMRWSATVSKFEPDVQADEVTPAFYKYAIGQIDRGLRPAPVLCVSHIDHGKPSDVWVAGDTDKMYIDGKLPKARGVFRDTPLGKALFAAVRRDINENIPFEERVRISMGFFDQESEPRVTKSEDGGEQQGRRFLKGWVKHFAATRVPVVAETNLEADMEVKAMPMTRKEDAASIVGDDLAEELLQATQKAVFGSEGLITKQDDEEEEETPEEEGAEEEEAEEEAEEEEEAETEGETEGEEEEEEEKGDYSELKALLMQLLEMLDTEYTVETEMQNARALGSTGTEPTRAEPFEERSVATPYAVEVAQFVDGFALQVKAVLLRDSDRTEKFAALQECINHFGEDVVGLVKEQTPPSNRDIADVVAQTVKSVVEPLQAEVAVLKAELAAAKANTLGVEGLPTRPAVPQSLDLNARVVSTEDAPPPMQRKAFSARELAWASTQERY